MKTSANHVISFYSSQNFVLSKVFSYQLKLKKETVVGASISFCYIHGNVFKRMMLKVPNLNFTAFSLTFLPIWITSFPLIIWIISSFSITSI